jgi:ABC-type glycerol-3-phosphate transport system substrate-binding protein
VAWWGGQARNDKMNELFDLFEEKHPNIKVSSEFTTENQYAVKSTTHQREAMLQTGCRQAASSDHDFMH